MTPIENDWTREIEKLTKQRDMLLASAKMALQALTSDRDINTRSVAVADLRAAIAEVEGA